MSDPIVVRTLVNATARELSELQHIAEGLQSVISTCEKPTDETLKAFQRLDYLTQSLEALSEFWFRAEPNLSSDLSLECDDALQNVRLKDLAASLRGDSKAESQLDQGILEEF